MSCTHPNCELPFSNHAGLRSQSPPLASSLWRNHHLVASTVKMSRSNAHLFEKSSISPVDTSKKTCKMMPASFVGRRQAHRSHKILVSSNRLVQLSFIRYPLTHARRPQARPKHHQSPAGNFTDA